MSDIGDEEIKDTEEVVPEPEEDEEVKNLEDAVPKVLKKSLMHDGLVRGLHEIAKALDARRVKCCFLAASCSEEAYTKLVRALCNEYEVPLIDVAEAKKLGEWAGLCKIDQDGQPRKVVGASCVAITDYGEESPALNFLFEHIKSISKVKV